jgi:hypothetical protein
MSFFHKYLKLVKQENYNEMAVSGVTKTALVAKKVAKNIGGESAVKNLKNSVSAINASKQLIKKPNIGTANKTINKINNLVSNKSSTGKNIIKNSLLSKYLGNKSNSNMTDNDDIVKNTINLIQKNYVLFRNSVFKKIEKKMKAEKDIKEKTNEIKIFYGILQKDDVIEYIISQYPNYKDDFKHEAGKEDIEKYLKNIKKIILEVEKDLKNIEIIKPEIEKFSLLNKINIDKTIMSSKGKNQASGKDENKILETVKFNFSNFHKNFMNIVKENSGNFRIPDSSEPIFRALMVSMGDFEKFVEEMPNLNNFKNMETIEKINFIEEKIKNSSLKSGIESNSLLKNIN